MGLRIAICDDDRIQADNMVSLVKKWGTGYEGTLDIESFPSAEAFLFRYSENKQYDILLLDVEMGGMDGVTLAKNIRKDNLEAQIVFVTGYNDYISEGYEVEALHYLLKPVTEQKLFGVLSRAVEKLRLNERTLYIKYDDEAVRIPLYRIRFLEVMGHYVTIHADSELRVKMTLAELEKNLSDDFFRTGRSHIVNLKYVRRITKSEVILSDATKIPLSRGCYEAINRVFIEKF